MKFRMEQHIQQKHADCATGGGNSVESKPNDISATIKQEDVGTATPVPHGAGLNLPNNSIVPEPSQHQQHHHHQNDGMVLPKPIEQQQHQQNQNGSAAAAMMMLNAGGSNHHHHHHLMDPQQQHHQQFMYHANYATSGYAPGQSKMESFDRVFASIR